MNREEFLHMILKKEWDGIEAMSEEILPKIIELTKAKSAYLHFKKVCVAYPPDTVDPMAVSIKRAREFRIHPKFIRIFILGKRRLFSGKRSRLGYLEISESLGEQFTPDDVQLIDSLAEIIGLRLAAKTL